jgi:hypothetical protein
VKRQSPTLNIGSSIEVLEFSSMAKPPLRVAPPLFVPVRKPPHGSALQVAADSV